MQTRSFGRTGHMSTIAIFGTAALYKGTPEMTEQAMEQTVLSGGVKSSLPKTVNSPGQPIWPVCPCRVVMRQLGSHGEWPSAISTMPLEKGSWI